MIDTTRGYEDPFWWTDAHSHRWETLKEELERRWAAAVPPPSPSELSWGHAEHAVRFGLGARSHHEDSVWSQDMELRLRAEWETANRDDASWPRIRHAVQWGWAEAATALEG